MLQILLKKHDNGKIAIDDVELAFCARPRLLWNKNTRWREGHIKCLEEKYNEAIMYEKEAWVWTSLTVIDQTCDMWYVDALHKVIFYEFGYGFNWML